MLEQMEKKVVNIPIHIPLITENDLYYNELIGYVLYFAAGILHNVNKKKLTSEELYIINFWQIIGRILSCFKHISQARNFILRRPTIKYLDRNEEMTVVDYYNYHYNVVIHKLNTIRDLSFKLINFVYDLQLKDKDCNWSNISKKKDLIAPGVLNIQILYYNLMMNIESERNESAHNGSIKANIFRDVDDLVTLSQWMRLNKLPKDFITEDPVAMGQYNRHLLNVRKKELLNKIDNYKTMSLYCIDALSCCMTNKYKSRVSKALSEDYSSYIIKANNLIDNYDRRVNKFEQIFPYLRENDNSIELLKKNKSGVKLVLNVSIVK